MALRGLTGDSLGVAKLDYPQRVKRVIFLFMNGGLSTIDAFDPKPMLTNTTGSPCRAATISTERKTGELMKSPLCSRSTGSAAWM